MHELLERYAAAWENNDRGAWLATFAEDAMQEDPVGGGIRRGRTEIGAFWDDAMSSYRSLAITPREIYLTGGEAAMVWRITAELDEGWRVFGGVDVFRFDATPLITSVRAYWEHEDRHFVSRSAAIHHLALADRWRAPTPDYRWSSVDSTLEDEGFIHCSFVDQVDGTARKYYSGHNDVLLLTIDPSLVPSEIKVENGYPHIYGPLPRDAVIRAVRHRQ